MATRRKFISQIGWSAVALSTPLPISIFNSMTTNTPYDVIIIGGSYSGLAAAMALGRSLKKVLLIDSGKPCNATTPYSHNFLTQDGHKPAAIAAIGRAQVAQYKTVTFYNGTAVNGRQSPSGFEIETDTGVIFSAAKFIFATGITDVMPNIKGFQDCWGISVLHCPYCHGYEVKSEKTGVLGNGDTGYEFVKLISNWTKDLTLFTNGKSTLTKEQTEKLATHHIRVNEQEITDLEHHEGLISHLVFRNAAKSPLKVLYAPRPFEQHCAIPKALGCEITEEGYIKVNPFQETSVPGVLACGDNTNRMRTVANAVATGTTAGMTAGKRLTLENF